MTLIVHSFASQLKDEAANKSNDVKINESALDKARSELEPLERELETLRKAARGQVSTLFKCTYEHMSSCKYLFDFCAKLLSEQVRARL
jgi:hypothetical protein